MVNPVSEGKRRAHAARRRRAAEQQLVAKHVNAEWRAKVQLMVRRALYARGNADEHVKGEQPHARRQLNRHVDDITQDVVVDFLRHPDWLTKGDGFIWRSIDFAIGDHFRASGKPGIGTRGTKTSFVNLLRAPAEDGVENAD